MLHAVAPAFLRSVMKDGSSSLQGGNELRREARGPGEGEVWLLAVGFPAAMIGMRAAEPQNPI